MDENSDESFEEIIPEKEEEDYEIITGLRDKIIQINTLSIEKSHVIFSLLTKAIFKRLG